MSNSRECSPRIALATGQNLSSGRGNVTVAPLRGHSRSPGNEDVAPPALCGRERRARRAMTCATCATCLSLSRSRARVVSLRAMPPSGRGNVLVAPLHGHSAIRATRTLPLPLVCGRARRARTCATCATCLSLSRSCARAVPLRAMPPSGRGNVPVAPLRGQSAIRATRTLPLPPSADVRDVRGLARRAQHASAFRVRAPAPFPCALCHHMGGATSPLPHCAAISAIRATRTLPHPPRPLHSQPLEARGTNRNDRYDRYRLASLSIPFRQLSAFAFAKIRNIATYGNIFSNILPLAAIP